MEYIQIGNIVNTHGLKGELKIQSTTDFEKERYQKGNTVYIKDESGYHPFTVLTYRSHKGFALVSFENYTNINLVEGYKGCTIYIAKQDRKPLDDGRIYLDELIGFEVVDENEKYIGKIIAIEDTLGAQANLRVELKDGRKVLIPFVRRFVIRITKARLTMHILEGLL